MHAGISPPGKEAQSPPGRKHPTPGKEAPPQKEAPPPPGRKHSPEAPPPWETAAAADGTHPTGMHSYLFEQLKQINSYKNIASEIKAYSLIENTLFPIISMLGSFPSIQAILFACLTNWYNTPLLAVIIKYDFPIN